jgi:hypothetical protein
MTAPLIKTFTINPARVYGILQEYPGFERYSRDNKHVCLAQNTIQAYGTLTPGLKFRLTNQELGGEDAGMWFDYPRYGLRFNGVERATYLTLAGEGATFVAVAPLPSWISLTPQGLLTINGPSAAITTAITIRAKTATRTFDRVFYVLVNDDTTKWRTDYDFNLATNGVKTQDFSKGFEREGILTGVLGGEVDGPYITELVGYDSSNTATVLTLYGLWVDRGGTAKDHPLVIHQSSNFDYMHPTDWDRSVPPAIAYALVPKTDLQTQPVPLPVRDPVPPLVLTPGTKLTRVDLVPTSDNDTPTEYRPAVTSRGITVVDNLQPYYRKQWIEDWPTLDNFDGKRNVATAHMPLFVHAGHAGGAYVMLPWSMARISANGDKTTFGGLRSKFARYWEDAHFGDWDAWEIVGDWDPNIPVNERWPRRSWGMVFDPRTTILDQTHALVTLADGRKLLPHPSVNGQITVTAFVTCEGLTPTTGRILRVDFPVDINVSPPKFGTPKWSVWVTGLSRPWSITWNAAQNSLLVSERGASRISHWSADTKQTNLGDFLFNPTGDLAGSVDQQSQRFFFANKVLAPAQAAAQLRSQDIVAPEGLVAQGDWVYYGMYALGEVRRKNVKTGQIQVCCRPTMADWITQTTYIHIAIGEDGTLYTTTFAITNFGSPEAWAPVPGVASDGTPLTHSKLVNWRDHAYDVIAGTGGRWATGGYPLGVGAGNGRLMYGTTSKGLTVFTVADPSEAAPDFERVKRGARVYRSKHYSLLHGQFGYGHAVYPKPFGEDADMDYALQQWGHSATAQPPPVDTTPPPVDTTPPPTPPPTGASMQFKSVALRNVTPDGSDLPPNVQPTDRFSPLTTTPIKVWRMKFHGSGGPGPTGTLGPSYSINGTKKRAVCDAINKLTHVNHDVDFLYTLFNAGSTTAPIFEFQPIDALPLDPYPGRDPNRTRLETWHNGYVWGSTPTPNTSKATGGTFEPFTQRKYDVMFEAEKLAYPNVDWSGRGSAYGGSMGGTACYNYALRRYNGGPGGIGPKFGVFYSANGRCRVSNAVGRPDPANVPDYNSGGDTLNPTVTVEGTSELYTHAFDHIQWLRDNPTIKTPMQCSASASHDSFSPTQDQIDLINANRITKRPHVDVLYNGYHDGTADNIILTRIKKTYTEDMFDGKKGWLVLLNSSADDDILQALSWPESTGGSTYPVAFHADTNVGYKWIIDEETPTSFKGRIYNALNDPSSGAVVDLGPTGTGYVAGATSVNLGQALGIGNVMPGDKIYFGFDPASIYTVTNTVPDVSRGSRVDFTPGLVKPMPPTMGGSRITLVIKTPVMPRTGAPISVDVGPYSDVFTTDVPMLRVTIQPGEWVPFAFDATATQPPPVVIPPAQIVAFTADVADVKPGDPVKLTYTTKDAVRVLIEDGNTSQQMLDVNGTFIVNPTTTTTYTCFADGADRIVAVAKLTVTVTAPPVVTTDPRVDVLVAQVATLEAELKVVQDFLVDTFDHFDPKAP